MNLQDVFAKLRNKEITFIGEGVRAQFDNVQQTPLGFQWRGRHYEVLKLLHTSINSEGYLQYLLLTNGGVFDLVLQRERSDSGLCRSRWVLNYRVKDDPAQNTDKSAFAVNDIGKEGLFFKQATSNLALIPLLLANVAHYHGHLCPELAIGYRAALIAQEELGLSRENSHRFFIVAENMSSAIESLQLITGCTIGNQNFFAYDLGKHVYYFGSFSNAHAPQKALRLALTNLVVDLSHTRELEKRIISGQADLEERREYQQAIDNAVEEILTLASQKLFNKTRISLQPPRTSGRLDYIRCSHCGEVTEIEKCNPAEKGFICRVCSAKAI